jgi:hypothetical protein
MDDLLKALRKARKTVRPVALSLPDGEEGRRKAVWARVAPLAASNERTALLNKARIDAMSAINAQSTETRMAAMDAATAVCMHDLLGPGELAFLMASGRRLVALPEDALNS